MKTTALNTSRPVAAVVADLVSALGSGEHHWSAFEKVGQNLSKWAKAHLVSPKRGYFLLPSDAGVPEKKPVAPVDHAKKIRERFDVLSILADGVVNQNIRSLMVAGAPGVGKTFTLEEKLVAAKKRGLVKDVVSIKGSISALGLYVALWENRRAGNVMILDDLDSIFGDEEAMNILKGALDTSIKRRISWAKASTFLADRDIPNSFDYEGQVVFITNTNPDAVIAKGSKMSPHMNALMSRSVFLDLCIHTPEAVLVRIEQVLAETSMAKDLSLSNSQALQIVEWMRTNVKVLRSISLRSVIQLASFMKTTSDWQKIASVTMCKAH